TPPLLVFLFHLYILRPRTNPTTGEPTWRRRKRRPRRKLRRRSKAFARRPLRRPPSKTQIRDSRARFCGHVRFRRVVSMSASQADTKKRRAAEAALQQIPAGSVLGIGTGSTVRFLVAALAANPGWIRAAVSSSNATTALLAAAGIPVLDLNDVTAMPLYIDGADEATRAHHLIKGGGALTREKIIAAAAARFICIIDESKLVGTLGAFPLPIEVIPMARNLIAR